MFVKLYCSLNDALSDGGASAKDQIASIAREADGLEEIFPAYAALLAWGEPGFREMVRIAAEGHTVKIKSAALTLLVGLALLGEIPNLALPFIDGALAARVNATLGTTTRATARRFLRQLILSTP